MLAQRSSSGDWQTPFTNAKSLHHNYFFSAHVSASEPTHDVDGVARLTTMQLGLTLHARKGGRKKREEGGCEVIGLLLLLLLSLFLPSLSLRPAPARPRMAHMCLYSKEKQSIKYSV